MRIPTIANKQTSLKYKIFKQNLIVAPSLIVGLSINSFIQSNNSCLTAVVYINEKPKSIALNIVYVIVNWLSDYIFLFVLFLPQNLNMYIRNW